jgi:hypothetical protein
MTEATLDEAASTALLLDQHIQVKIMTALVDVVFDDPQKISVLRAMEQGHIGYATAEFRRTLVLSIVNDYTFQQNMRQMLVTAVRDEVRSAMERERLAAQPTYVTLNSSTTRER